MQNISVILTSVSSRSYNIQGFLLKSKAYLSFCINVLEFSNSVVTSGVNEGMRDICLYTLHVYHVYLDGLENYHFPRKRGRQLRCNKLQFMVIFFSWMISQNETNEFSLRTS